MSQIRKDNYCYSVGQKTRSNDISFSFLYGSTKKINVHISKNYADISWELQGKQTTSKEEKLNSYAYNLLKEAIKRAEIIHIIFYNTSINWDRAILKIEDTIGNTFQVDNIESLKTFNMINCQRIREISPKIKDENFIIKMFYRNKTEIETEMASLNAYIFSKYKEFETERFLYLWMSFNGMYSILARETVKGNQEKLRIEYILEKYFSGGTLLKAEKRRKYAKQMLLLFSSTKPDTIMEDAINPNSEFYKKVKDFIDSNYEENNMMNPAGFVIGEVAYLLRCDYFHSDLPIMLVAFENDYELKALMCINSFLESFLDNHLNDIIS